MIRHFAAAAVSALLLVSPAAAGVSAWHPLYLSTQAWARLVVRL